MTEYPADIFTEPESDDDTLANLGPLRRLAGTWRGKIGKDVNPKAEGPEHRDYYETIDLQPTVAFAISPQISIGGGINIEHASASLGNFLPNLSPLLPDGHQMLKGKGWDLGWSAGAQFHTGPISVGLSYKSSVKHKLDGTVTTSGLLGPLAGQNGTISTSASFRTPWQAIASVRFKATDRLTLNGQVVRFGWIGSGFLCQPTPSVVMISRRHSSFLFSGSYSARASWRWR